MLTLGFILPPQNAMLTMRWSPYDVYDAMLTMQRPWCNVHDAAMVTMRRSRCDAHNAWSQSTHTFYYHHLLFGILTSSYKFKLSLCMYSITHTSLGCGVIFNGGTMYVHNKIHYNVSGAIRPAIWLFTPENAKIIFEIKSCRPAGWITTYVIMVVRVLQKFSNQIWRERELVWRYCHGRWRQPASGSQNCTWRLDM